MHTGHTAAPGTHASFKLHLCTHIHNMFQILHILLLSLNQFLDNVPKGEQSKRWLEAPSPLLVTVTQTFGML